jgi:hypothetical protein
VSAAIAPELNLVNKLLALAQWDYSWQADIRRRSTGYVGAAKRRIAHIPAAGITSTARRPFQSVTIDGHRTSSEYAILPT